MIKKDKCVICSKQIKDIGLNVTDNLVTSERFSLYKCTSCELLHTIPIPEEKELTKYYNSGEYISHTKKPGSFFERLYFIVRNRMSNKKIRFIKKHIKRKPELLDFGCGTGVFLMKCVEKGWSASGFENNKSAATIAKSNTDTTIFQSIKQLTSNNKGSFDVITLWHVIEHVHNIEETINCLMEVLKDNGLLIIAMPNYESYDSLFYKEKWAGYDAPRHLYHFNDNAVKGFAKKYGFFISGKKPLIYDSYFISLLSEGKKNLVVKYFRAAAIGFVSNLFGVLKIKPYSSQVYFLKRKQEKNQE